MFAEHLLSKKTSGFLSKKLNERYLPLTTNMTAPTFNKEVLPPRLEVTVLPRGWCSKIHSDFDHVSGPGKCDIDICKDNKDIC